MQSNVINAGSTDCPLSPWWRYCGIAYDLWGFVHFVSQEGGAVEARKGSLPCFIVSILYPVHWLKIHCMDVVPIALITNSSREGSVHIKIFLDTVEQCSVFTTARLRTECYLPLWLLKINLIYNQEVESGKFIRIHDVWTRTHSESRSIAQFGNSL